MPPTIIGVVGGYFLRNAARAAACAAGSPVLPPRPPRPRPSAPGGGGRKPATGPWPPTPGVRLGISDGPNFPPFSSSGVCAISPTSLPVFVSYLRTVFCPRYVNPLLSMSIPCPWGASNDPTTVPSLSIWIIDGGRAQQSDTPSSDSSSRFV